jgi:hypothetical protein
MRSTGKITFQRELRDKRSGIKKEVRGPQKKHGESERQLR